MQVSPPPFAFFVGSQECASSLFYLIDLLNFEKKNVILFKFAIANIIALKFCKTSCLFFLEARESMYLFSSFIYLYIPALYM